eukprot:XP_014783130.1 PREDICTED: uncharacterized protein LOC106878434 [Octopus bimaculoides]
MPMYGQLCYIAVNHGLSLLRRLERNEASMLRRMDNVSMHIRQIVKLVLRKHNADIHSLIFDGRGTNYISWFQESKLISSPPWFGNYRGNYEFNYNDESITIRPYNYHSAMRAKKGEDNNNYRIFYRENIKDRDARFFVDAMVIYILLQ